MPFLDISDNKQKWDELVKNRDQLVPFVGAGFSMPVCPGWGQFLENCYQRTKEGFFYDTDIKNYETYKASHSFEEMAVLLAETLKEQRFKDELKNAFKKRLDNQIKKRFDLFHETFPHLKITTNYDTLLESERDASAFRIVTGIEKEKIDRTFVTDFRENVLIKIHGDIRDNHSIILTRDQYAGLYGQQTGYNSNAPFTRFMTRVYQSCTLLFIGCSLVNDRTLLILADLKIKRPHFALLKVETDKHKRIELNRRLSSLCINPIWLNDYNEIEEVLEKLNRNSPESEDIGKIKETVSTIKPVATVSNPESDKVKKNLVQQVAKSSDPGTQKQEKQLWMDSHGKDQYGRWADIKVKSMISRMRWIDPGEFLMGSPANEPERLDNELQHKVIITKGYWMAETACTQELWEAVMTNNPSVFKGGKNLPVETVSWDNCIEFITKINKLNPEFNLRLPTEAEWEYACRARTTTPFSFGSNITTDQVNYNGNYPYNNGKKGKYRKKTVTVKSFPCNEWGLYEMHGNVWEWCADWYGKEYYNECNKQGIVENPKGQETGGYRVLRGGSWSDDAGYARSACRDRYEPSYRNNVFGFRLARGQ